MAPDRPDDATVRYGGYLPAVGWATGCRVSANHSPVPLRFVWHHILPQTCGGQSVSENLANCCDSCHYAIHALLHDLKVHGGKFTIPARLRNHRRAALAQQGYRAAVAAGTVDQIPNEGTVDQ